jgi:hypothetical protein
LGIFEKPQQPDPANVFPPPDETGGPVSDAQLPILWKVIGYAGAFSIYWLVLGLWLPAGAVICASLLAWFIYDAFANSRFSKSQSTKLSLR